MAEQKNNSADGMTRSAMHQDILGKEEPGTVDPQSESMVLPTSQVSDDIRECEEGSIEDCEQWSHGKSTGDLPDEILDHLLTFVSPYKDMKNCQQVSHRWYHAVKRVQAKLHRLLTRSLDELHLAWYHYDTPSPLLSAAGASHRVITKRCAHSAAMLDGRMYVFGGCGSRMTSFNDLWWLELGRLDWHRPPAVGCYPSPKAYATMVTHGHRLVLFGGWSQAALYPLHPSWKLFDELHMYDTKENCWEEIRGITQYGGELPGCEAKRRWPPKMARHGASVHGHEMVVVGGLHHHPASNRFEPSGDVWVFDFLAEEWRIQLCTEPAPSARYGHSQIVIDDKHMLMLGGQYYTLSAGGVAGPYQLRQDAWLLEMGPPTAPWRWHHLKVEGIESKPSHVWCHPACQVGDRVVVLGHMPSDVPIPWKSPQPSRDNMHAAPPVRVPAHSAFRPAGLVRTAIHPTDRRFGAGPSSGGPAARPSSPSGPETGQLTRRVPPPQLPPPPGHVAPRPSVRPNARDSRTLRLANLRRMEARLQAVAAERAAPLPWPRARAPLTAGYRLVAGSGRRQMVVHVLDASGAVSRHTVRWWHGHQPDGPDERILYSLVAARGELVMFGGIVTPPRSHDFDSEQNCAYNSLSFITAPCGVFT